MEQLKRLLLRYFCLPQGAVILALGVGLALRLSITAGLQFPLNDGGFWYAFARAISNADFALPQTIPFNGEEILATYPPLAAYLLTALERYLRIDLLTLLIWVPFFLNIATLCVFLHFTLALLGRTTAAYATMLAFAVLPTSYRWFLMGGGVSRGLGLLFLLLSWSCLARQADTSKYLSSLLAGFFAGLAILSHPVAGLLVVSGGVALLLYKKMSLPSAAVAAGMLLLVILPWALCVLTRYGATPYFNAFLTGEQGGSGIFSTLLDINTYSPLKSFCGLAVIGILLNLARPWSFGFTLFVLILLLMPRTLQIDFGCIPLSLLTGEGIAFLWSALKTAAQRKIALGAGIIAFGFLALIESGSHAKLMIRQSLRSEEIQEIRQLDELLPAKRQLIVLSQHFVAGDAVGEWIGTLTKHRAVLTHQLQEWTGNFTHVLDEQFKVEECCANPTPACTERVISYAKRTEPAALVWLHRRSCRGLELELRASGRLVSNGFPSEAPLLQCWE